MNRDRWYKSLKNIDIFWSISFCLLLKVWIWTQLLLYLLYSKRFYLGCYFIIFFDLIALHFIPNKLKQRYGRQQLKFFGPSDFEKLLSESNGQLDIYRLDVWNTNFLKHSLSHSLRHCSRLSECIRAWTQAVLLNSFFYLTRSSNKRKSSSRLTSNRKLKQEERNVKEKIRKAGGTQAARDWDMRPLRLCCIRDERLRDTSSSWF